MTFLLLLAALVMAGAGIWVSRRWRVLGQVIMALGGLGLVGVVALQVRQNVFAPQPRMPDRCEMAVSYCLANCLLGDFAGQSGSVVLLFPQRRFMNADTEQSYEEGFIPPLRHGHGMLRLKALRLEGGDRNAGQASRRSDRHWRKPRRPWQLFLTLACHQTLKPSFQPGNPKPRLSTSLTRMERPIGLRRSRMAASGPWCCLGPALTPAVGQPQRACRIRFSSDFISWQRRRTPTRLPPASRLRTEARVDADSRRVYGWLSFCGRGE